MNSSKLGPIIAIVIIVGALGFGAVAFKGSMVAYVPFQQAANAASTGATVQIMGGLVPGETHFNSDTKSLDFTLKETDTGATMPVVFKSPKPDNFDRAVKVTAIGKYDPTKKVFVADNLLVKCPSKYAGESGDQDRSYNGKS
ncbi:MAG TPA: cytochrome c maturation protein CcmE [Capsulimonadaceae bacterium]